MPPSEHVRPRPPQGFPQRACARRVRCGTQGGVERDGNGWARCAAGHRHWGRHGAAGLLLHAVDDSGVVRVLLQHRAPWSHHGDTWGLPGGARDSHEDVVVAALREAAEEAGLDPAAIRTRHGFVDDHGGWSYTTVYADVPAPVGTVANDESAALVWVPVHQVDALNLHPGFARTWPQARARPTVLLVDAANVVGSRPDGWWRDRAGAAARLLDQVAGLRSVTVRGPDGATRVIAGAVAVLEGAASSAAAPDWVDVRRTPRGTSGDDVLAEAAARLVAQGKEVVAVSADVGLRARWAAQGRSSPPSTVSVVGPRWLLEQLEGATTAPRTG